MNRRKVLLGSEVALLTALAGCTGGSDENGGENGDENGSDNGEDDENTEAEITGVYNYRKYDRLTTPDSDDGVYWESDEETQYVGAQVQLTNNTAGELSLKGFELSILAGGDGENISIHGNSNTDPLEAIGAGETVETWMFFTASRSCKAGPTTSYAPATTVRSSRGTKTRTSSSSRPSVTDETCTTGTYLRDR